MHNVNMCSYNISSGFFRSVFPHFFVHYNIWRHQLNSFHEICTLWAKRMIWKFNLIHWMQITWKYFHIWNEKVTISTICVLGVGILCIQKMFQGISRDILQTTSRHQSFDEKYFVITIEIFQTFLKNCQIFS